MQKLYQGTIRIGKPRLSFGELMFCTLGTLLSIFCMYGVALMACLILAGV